MNFEGSLNNQQKEAVYHTQGPLLIFAGAGSGKTRVLMYKIAYLVENDFADPNEILAVTFTNKAAEEMKERISAMLPGKTFPWIGTFHSFCARLLRMQPEVLGFNRNFLIYDESDKKSVIKEVLRQLNLDEKVTAPEKMSSIISRFKNKLISPDMCDISSFEGRLIQSVYALYQQKLKAYGALDFDELLVQTNQLLRGDSEFANKIKNKFKYILIDEYQDINYAQYMLVKPLSALHKNITVVGDDDQSIYRFRGADMSILLKFEEDYPDAKVVKLEQNYRSTSIILAAANALLSHNKIRKEKKLWTDGEAGEKISLYKAVDGRAEARFVIRKIKELISGGKYTYKDFVVIYRTNAQSRLFEEECIRDGIPYNLVGSLKFYDRKEIKDFLAYLRLVTDVNDNISFKRIINVPPRGIGQSNLARLEDIAQYKAVSLFEAARILKDTPTTSPKVKASLDRFVEIIEESVKKATENNPLEIAQYLIETLNFREYLLSPSKNAEGIAREENLNEFLNVLKEFQEISENSTIPEFLSHITLISDIDMWESSEGRVNLMTFHLTKGLEFPVVFLTGLEERFLPHFMSSSEESAVEEERRLFYVGITRARHKLFLTNSQQRLERGISEQRFPSRFLKEIPGDCLLSLSIAVPRGNIFRDIHNRHINQDYSSFFEAESSNSVASYKKGDAVSHSIFGKGRVLDISGDAVKVDFVTKGIKTVVRSFLEPV